MVKKLMEIKPCKNNIGAEIKTDLNHLDNTKISKLKNSLDNFGIIFFRNQNLNSESYIKFAKGFGTIAHYPMLKGLSNEFPEITVVERKETDKGPSFGEQFHTDSSYTQQPPRYTMLMGKLVPPRGKGNTEFASQYHAYEALSDQYKSKLENLEGIFSSSGPISVTRLEREQEKGTGKARDFEATHKIINEINNRKAIYCSPGHMIKIKGLNKIEDKNIRNFLFEHQIKREFILSFEWEKNTIAIWDNRSILHQATPFSGKRIMHRITIQ